MCINLSKFSWEFYACWAPAEVAPESDRSPAAAIAVATTAAIPQLGFIHEDSGQSFILDIADLFRDELTVPCAFKAALAAEKRPNESIERLTRRSVGERLRRDQVIPTMIDRIKALFVEEKPE